MASTDLPHSPTVTTYPGPDGVALAYRAVGTGRPLVCLAGGPMRDAEYLGDLGGLSGHRLLVVPDLRGTGHSPAPTDPTACRCDRLVADVEALRVHLGLDRLDLLAHSAGTNLAARYAERHPDRIASMVLVTPSAAAVGIEVTEQARREAVLARMDEPWFDAGMAAMAAVLAGTATEADWAALVPFKYGRWDDQARAHHAAERVATDRAAAYRADGAFDPPATRAALAGLAAPVLVVAGEADPNTPLPAAAAYAQLCADGRLAVQAGAGHFPWLYDADDFVAIVTEFLG